jgi:hypothetical protein
VATLLTAHEQFTFDDRVLAHVRRVVTQKLRRNESLELSWSQTAMQGSGRYTLWLTEASQLHFRFAGDDHIELDRRWLEAMTVSANSVHGLNLDEVPDPALDRHGAR